MTHILRHGWESTNASSAVTRINRIQLVIPSDRREPRNLQLFFANHPPIAGCPTHDTYFASWVGTHEPHRTQQGGPSSHKE